MGNPIEKTIVHQHQRSARNAATRSPSSPTPMTREIENEKSTPGTCFSKDGLTHHVSPQTTIRRPAHLPFLHHQSKVKPSSPFTTDTSVHQKCNSTERRNYSCAKRQPNLWQAFRRSGTKESAASMLEPKHHAVTFHILCFTHHATKA